MNDSNMERTLKNLARLLGLFLLIISIYLSYDGFDQGVTGGNANYSGIAKAIGIVIAITICAIQFIFGSRYDQLNTTLKIVGFASYAYSIYTNYLGAKHLLHMDETTALVTAFFMDIVPEPMISWSLGDSMKGDVFGNIGKWITGYQPKPQQQQQSPKQGGGMQPQFRPAPNAQGNHGGQKNHGGGERRAELERERSKNHPNTQPVNHSAPRQLYSERPYHAMPMRAPNAPEDTAEINYDL